MIVVNQLDTARQPVTPAPEHQVEIVRSCSRRETRDAHSHVAVNEFRKLHLHAPCFDESVSNLIRFSVRTGGRSVTRTRAIDGRGGLVRFALPGLRTGRIRRKGTPLQRGMGAPVDGVRAARRARAATSIAGNGGASRICAIGFFAKKYIAKISLAVYRDVVPERVSRMLRTADRSQWDRPSRSLRGAPRDCIRRAGTRDGMRHPGPRLPARGRRRFRGARRPASAERADVLVGAARPGGRRLREA